MASKPRVACVSGTNIIVLFFGLYGGGVISNGVGEGC